MANILLAPCKALFHFFRYFYYGLLVIPRAIMLPFKREEKLIADNGQHKKNQNLGTDLSTRLNDFGESVIDAGEKAGDFVNEQSNKISFLKKMNNTKMQNRTEFKVNFDGDDAKKNKEKIVYAYEAEDADGKLVKGYFEAFSVVEVNSYLKSEGYKVYDIKTSKLIQFFHGSQNNFQGKFKTKDLIFLLAQLSTYLKAGIPLAEAVKILVKQFDNPTYKKIIVGVSYNLSLGQNFSEALESQGEAFPRLLINMVKTSEMTGELPETLDDMEEYYTEVEATRKAMISAMMYPVIIFIIAIAVGTFIMLYVVPKFVEIYDSMDNAEIPLITKFVLGLSDFLSNYIIWIGVAVVLLLLLYIYLYRNIKTFRSSIQWFLMHLPGFGNIIIYNEVTMFTKTFASLLAHNVFITDTMDILGKVSNNEIYKGMIADAITNISKGGKVSTAFKSQWAFPIPAYEMIVTGEKTGQLPEMMQKVSDYYQDLHKNAVARIKTFIEPVMIIFLTVMVGVIVLSIVVPMFNMYSAIQQ